MMSKKEYMYWQNRKDRVSEYICVRASEQFLEFLMSFTVKKVSFFTINVKFKVILSSKSGGGGMFVQAIPPPQKVGGGGGNTSPPSPRDLRQCWSENAALFKRLMEIHSNTPILYYGFQELTERCHFIKQNVLFLF